MKRHMEKCKKNNGKIVKKVILEKFARPFVPHILSNVTYRYLFVYGRENEFKPTEYYITYDIETFEKFIQQNYGEESMVVSQLIPYCIASTVKNKSGIHSFCYDIRQANFLDQWLDQVFEETKQIKKDNKYEDESIPQHFEVPVIGFNSAKFDVSLVFKNLKSKNWKIVKHIGSGTVAKQIIVRHKDTHIQLRFVDALIYCTKMKLKEFVRDIGMSIMKKGRFPYEFININNYATELDKSEPFPREAFDNKLKNKSLSEAKYQEYLIAAAKYATRWDYLRYYNVQDTLIMLQPIDNLIRMMFKYKIDMLSMFSMSQCANAIKYSSAYDDFEMNGNYNVEDTDKPINITMPYWRAKVDSYIEQDQKKNRDISNNVTIDDYEYFKEIFEKQSCYICHSKFTWKNRPTLDRIDNELSHSKDNVFPCCLYCNKYKGNRDEKQMKLMIQLRKYSILKQLPMTLVNQDVYTIIRKNITGGLSNVLHRYNVAGETRINHLEYDVENKCVYSIDSEHIMTHIIQLDFDSQYASIMSSESHPFIRYTCHKIFMCGQVLEYIVDQDRCNEIIYNKNRFTEDEQICQSVPLFIAQVKGHIDENYINYCINFGPIIRNIDIPVNEETIGKYMYKHLVDNNLPRDKVERKLTNLVDTHNEVMSFNNYYLWILIDQFHFIIDEIKSVTTFSKHDKFNGFVKDFMQQRAEAKSQKNDGLATFCKLILNSAFGGDILNSEKYSNIRLYDDDHTFQSHLFGSHYHDIEIADNLHAVQVDSEYCRCNNCLQVGYFTLDSAKYFYINFIYYFLYKAFDQTKMHIVQLDTDSLTLAICGDKNRGPEQRFDAIIKDQEFYDKNKGFFFSEGNQRKILGVHFEKQGLNCIALSPKNYIINDECGDVSLVAKGVFSSISKNSHFAGLEPATSNLPNRFPNHQAITANLDYTNIYLFM
ncbi:MAG: hypothetical protein EZS28_025270 [Streblomastix strix]|uniref:DNA-directed DNA polymerase n=1 Tax=Streblomastix strix TaxID=222440 RepID=A0A5J4V9M6_9EUKA|nr:MAG: hypothetical protein EZS28_025270 [Streblomastix strix]